MIHRYLWMGARFLANRPCNTWTEDERSAYWAGAIIAMVSGLIGTALGHLL